ncbi:glycoside hydrolase family 6 protein [Streptomyces sp. MNU89]|uniref:glycoside hydrolase family 6 protein n=1 Tax=Streptomyces sp. MNU89 TaxID=2560025 RepID=UPI001E4F1004|nr:glycoside hydrolase family 6 protein [Streptomyces sp. MNU89]MCC9741334.1 glycoside hydrolase family 6 protein [Streptomyces sp. MNU89]
MYGHMGRLAASVAAGAVLLIAGCFRPPGPAPGPSPGDDRAQPPRRAPQSSATPFWVNPHGTAARQAAALRARGRADEAGLIQEKIAAQPVAEWIGTKAPRAETARLTRAAARESRDALLVLYNIPHRDCGQFSKGGAPDGTAYRRWLAEVVAGIGDRPATVILEPDAVPHIVDGCTPPVYHQERYRLLAEAVERLKTLPRTRVYLDAGNPRWITDPGRLTGPLRRAGIDRADGFALNTANYRTTAENRGYGRALSRLLGGGKTFVIDTSRNGNGPLPASGGQGMNWCNPPGRALGEPPTTRTGDELVDAYLWIKRPGESDGTCRGGPPAGRWWTEYALDLARNADW